MIKPDPLLWLTLACLISFVALMTIAFVPASAFTALISFQFG